MTLLVMPTKQDAAFRPGGVPQIARSRTALARDYLLCSAREPAREAGSPRESS